MAFSKRVSQRSTESSLTYEKLEDRRVLTTIFLDFGDRFVGGELSFSEQEYISELGGVAIGDNASNDTIALQSFSPFGDYFEYDYNRDRVIDQKDNEDFQSETLELMKTYFAAYDVQLVMLTSEFINVNGTMVRAASSIADVQATLAADSGNDSYVFVSKLSVDVEQSALDSGGSVLAKLDVGNSEDSTLLTNLDNILLNFRDRGPRVFDSQVAFFASRGLGKSFGLETVKSDFGYDFDQNDQLLNSEMMAHDIGGSDRVHPYGASQDEYFNLFSDYEFETQEGTIAATQNSHALLTENLGSAGLNLFKGTGGDDHFTLEVTGSHRANLTIETFNSQFLDDSIRTLVFSNIDTRDLIFEPGLGQDLFNIDPRLEDHLEIYAGDEAKRLRIIGSGTEQMVLAISGVDRKLERSAAMADYSVDLGNGGSIEATLYGVTLIENVDELTVDKSLANVNSIQVDYSSNGNEYLAFWELIEWDSEIEKGTGIAYSAFADIKNLRINSSDQFDSLHFATPMISGIDNFYLDAGGGDDMIEVGRIPGAENGSGSVTVDGGAGNDSFKIEEALNEITFLGGLGNDTFDVKLQNFVLTQSINIDGGQGQDHLDVWGSSHADEFMVFNPSGISLYENREIGIAEIETGLVETRRGNDKVIINGGTFDQLTIKTNSGDDRVTLNDTKGIGELSLNTNTDNDRVTINRTDNKTKLDLKTGAGSDRVFIYSVHGANSINTNNGNDFVYVGSTAGANNGDLDLIPVQLNLVGGSNDVGGVDRLYVNDRGATGDFDYRIHPRWIVNQPDGDSPTRTFGGIHYDPSFEIIRLDGSDGENEFEAIPSFWTRYVFDGNLPTSNPGDLLQVNDITGTGQNVSTGVGHGYWTFNGAKSIYYQSMERTNSGDNDSSGFRLPSNPQVADNSRFENFGRTVDTRDNDRQLANATTFVTPEGELLDAAMAILMLRNELN